MVFEKYTDRAKGLIENARTLAAKSNHQLLTPLHVLKSILRDEEGLGIRLIDAAGGQSLQVDEMLEQALAKLPEVEVVGHGQIFLAPETTHLFDQSENLAREAGDSFVTVEFLLLALTNSSNSAANQILKDASVTTKNLKKAIN